MKNFTIKVVGNEISFVHFIKEIYELGHKIHIATTSQKIKDFCDNEMIELNENKFPDQFDVIIAETFVEELLENADIVLIPKVSYGSLSDSYECDTLAYWECYEKKSINLCGLVQSQKFGMPRANLLKETLAEIIVDISREEALKTIQMPNTKTINLSSAIPVFKILKNLLHRYFGRDKFLARSKKKLHCAKLELRYEIEEIKEEELDESGLFFICKNILSGENVIYPEALLYISRTDQKTSITLTANNYGFKYFLDHILNLSNAYLKGIPLNFVNILTASERLKIYGDINGLKLEDPKISIVDKFSELVENSPDKIAIVFGDESWSYRQLEIASDNIAKQLIATDFPDESPVLLAIDRSPLAVAGILGVLKAGYCYVPVDPAYPEERISAIIQDMGDVLCLSSKADQKLFSISFDKLNTIWVDQIDLTAKVEKTKKPTCENIAYIIYTSGSTGEPKGVVIEHGNIVNLVQSEAIVCGLSSSSRILNVASFGFDAAGWDIYGALLTGATLFIAAKEIYVSPAELHRFIEKKQITFATLTPAVLALMPRVPLQSLETLVVMGDVCPDDVMVFWSQQTRVLNGYGSTEATIGATISLYKTNQEKNCIGRPLHNYEAYILDEHLNIKPIGSKGQIYLAGAGLARGYYNNSEMTDERFVYYYGKRLYRTGDLGYWNEHGDIVFLGRNEYQVKISGIRLELREVENFLEQHPSVEQALTITAGEGGNKHLIVYVTLNSMISVESLKKHLGSYLHPSVIPPVIMILDEFPINFNGKIDRKNLPKPVYDYGESMVNKSVAAYQEIIQDLIRSKEIPVD